MFKDKFKTRPITETITVGGCLQRKREELNLSLEELSRKLGIKREYLESLEKGDYTQLPPSVYVRGFIKSYANCLGIDAPQLVKIYNRETTFVLNEDERENRRRSEKANHRGWKEYFTVTPRILTCVCSVCIVSVLGYYFMHQINSFNSKPYLFVDNPLADGVVQDQDLWVSGRTESDAILRINGQEISVNGQGDFKEKITLSEGRNLLVVEAKNRFNKTDVRQINIVYTRPAEDKIVIKESEAPIAEKPIDKSSIVEEDSGAVAAERTAADAQKKASAAQTEKTNPVKEISGSVLGAQASAATMEEEEANGGSEEQAAPQGVPAGAAQETAE